MTKPLKLADFLRPRKPCPADEFEDKDAEQYWLKDGVVHFRFNPIKGADADTFRYFLGGFAVDKKHAYAHGKRLQADVKTFAVLNFTYAKDSKSVWAIGIRMPTADPKTFVVCDDGALHDDECDILLPYSYGKDKKGVYYYDYDGKPTLLKKADPSSFNTSGDKHFGKDANFVFAGAAVLPKADCKTWKLIAGHYSRDAKRVFYGMQEVKGADPKKFKVLGKGEGKFRAGTDGGAWFFHDMPIKQKDYDGLVSGKLDCLDLQFRMQKRNAGKS